MKRRLRRDDPGLTALRTPIGNNLFKRKLKICLKFSFFFFCLFVRIKKFELSVGCSSSSSIGHYSALDWPTQDRERARERYIHTVRDSVCVCKERERVSTIETKRTGRNVAAGTAHIHTHTRMHDDDGTAAQQHRHTCAAALLHSG